jgi:predicted helicase
MSDCYNKEVARYEEASLDEGDIDVHSFVEADPKKIKWTRELKDRLVAGKTSSNIEENKLAECMYRPFSRQWVYYERMFVSQMYQTPKIFPESKTRQLCILISGLGDKEPTCLLSDSIGNLNCLHSGTQAFPLEMENASAAKCEPDLLGESQMSAGNISNYAMKLFRDAYGDGVTQCDIFYYVYGILHSAEYRERFAADLKKMLPRIPLTKNTKDFWAFSQAGRDLAEWHLNYETIEPWPLEIHDNGPMTMPPLEKFKVKKMTFARPTKAMKEAGEKYDKTQIKYNEHITLSGIPTEAYKYVVNGKPAIEWIMDRYQVTVDKKSGIRNDPNDWCKEHDDPRYILDLIGRIVRVSMETNKIVDSLPPLNEQKPD